MALGVAWAFHASTAPSLPSNDSATPPLAGNVPPFWMPGVTQASLVPGLPVVPPVELPDVPDVPEVDADVVVVAFRGTQPDRPVDWLSDFEASPETWAHPVGTVHKGFYEALRVA